MLRSIPGHHRLAWLVLLCVLGLAGPRLAWGAPGAPAGAPRASGGSGSLAQERADDLPPAAPDLGLRVVGTVIVKGQGKSLVVLENRNSGAQGVLHEGDRWGEVLVRRVLPQGVVVDAGRGDEFLATAGAGSAGPGQAPPPSGGTPAVVNRSEVAPELPTAPQSAQQIRTRLAHRGGKLRGLMVYNIQPGSAFARMGLQDGDVIIAVNGEPVTTTEEILELYRTMEQGGTFSLEVDRGEVPQELRFEIR